MRMLQPGLRLARHGARGVFTLILWTVWLALALILAFQIFIACTHELEVPPSLLRQLETRLAASGVRATFGRTTFDPSGRLLVENVRAHLPSFPEPIATARALYVRLDPWTLLFGRFQELELHVSGVTLFVPAMLSSSGRAEELVRDLDATFVPGSRLLTLTHFSCYLGSLPITAHGTAQLGAPRPTGAAPFPVAEFLAKNYPPLSRRLAALTAQLAYFEEPRLHLELTPAGSRGALADVTFSASGLRLPDPAVQSGPLILRTRLPLLGDDPVATTVSVSADALTLPADTRALLVRAMIHGTLRPGQFSFDPLDAEITAAEVRAPGAITLDSASLRLVPGPLPRLRAELNTHFAGQPLAFQIDADLDARTASVDFFGKVDDGLLAVISARIGQDVRQWINFPEVVTISSAHATFAPGWQWEKLHARLFVPSINAYHVPLTEGRVALELTPTRLWAPEAYGRIGDNFARGSYDHDPRNHRYRFLLEGKLQPLAISGWFGEWWPDFFKNLVFLTTPAASVEVAGRWGLNTVGESRQIVFGESAEAVIYGARFDSARARLFIRPHFLDALEFSGTLDAGEAHGTFSRHLDPITFAWQRIDLDVASTLAPAGPAQMFGSAGTEILAPFFFERPPELTLRGHFDSPAAPGGAHESIDITARSNGVFRFHEFPFDRIALTVALRDDVLTLDPVAAGFAEGTITGRTKVWGRGAERRISFDYALKNASLGRAIAEVERYAAVAKPPTAAKSTSNRFLSEKSVVRLDLAAAAEGLYDDVYSFRGEGSGAISGAELGEVKLLGLLSDLFSFTSLRFNAARARFRIEGPRLVFPDVVLSGSNSAINAHGSYSLDRKELDFNAKIFPFQESSAGLKTIVGAVLSPLSNAFEVKLTGPLDRPSWRFLISPTNFLRNLSEGSAAPAPATPLATPAVPPAVPPPPAPPRR